MIFVVFQFLKFVLFFYYIKLCADPAPKRLLLIEKIFIMIFSAAVVASWNIQIILDSSRAPVIGLEMGWTYLYANNLFGQWPWKSVVYISTAIFGLVRAIVSIEEFSLGPIQAGVQVALILLTACLDERQTRLKSIKTISLEKN